MGVVKKNMINSKSSFGYRLARKCEDIKEQLYKLYSYEKYENADLVSVLGAISGGNDGIAEVECNTIRGREYRTSIYANSGLSKKLSSSTSIPIAYVPSPTDSVFEKYTIRTTPMRDINTGSIPRIYDTEYKLLEYIAGMLEFDSRVYGEIRLYTRLQPCLSCDIVFVKFADMFPNIKIEVYYEKEYNSLTRTRELV